MLLAFTLHINFQVCVFIVFVCMFGSTFLYYGLNESNGVILGFALAPALARCLEVNDEGLTKIVITYPWFLFK